MGDKGVPAFSMGIGIFAMLSGWGIMDCDEALLFFDILLGFSRVAAGLLLLLQRR